jgi:hypothetical protein
MAVRFFHWLLVQPGKAPTASCMLYILHIAIPSFPNRCAYTTTMEPPLLTYGDVTLYESDVALLQPPAWLNDKIILFYFEYLARRVFPSSELLFVVPEMISLLTWTQG